MTTHFTTSSQQYNNRTIDNTVPVPASAGSDVLLVATVTAVSGGASASIEAQFLNAQGQILLGLASRINAVGQSFIGAGIPAGATQVRAFFSVTNRVTMSIRVVSFARGEDVPETF